VAKSGLHRGSRAVRLSLCVMSVVTMGCGAGTGARTYRFSLPSMVRVGDSWNERVSFREERIGVGTEHGVVVFEDSAVRTIELDGAVRVVAVDAANAPLVLELSVRGLTVNQEEGGRTWSGGEYRVSIGGEPAILALGRESDPDALTALEEVMHLGGFEPDDDAGGELAAPHRPGDRWGIDAAGAATRLASSCSFEPNISVYVALGPTTMVVGGVECASVVFEGSAVACTPPDPPEGGYFQRGDLEWRRELRVPTTAELPPLYDRTRVEQHLEIAYPHGPAGALMNVTIRVERTRVREFAPE
jgi:hypothetical protein